MISPGGRRGWLLASLAVVILATGLVAAYRLRGRVEPARLGPTSATIVPGIHILNGLGPSAAYVVETSDGLILVDTGLDTDAGPLRTEMAKLGLDWRRLRAILLTHAHGDHCGGAEFLRDATGAKVYAGRDDAAVIKAGQPREAVFSTFYMPEHAAHATRVDVELAGGETLNFGDASITAIAAPGHTPGSVCYLMLRGGLRVLFGGDVITMLHGDGNPHPTGLKPLGTYSAYLSPRYRGDAGAYLATLRKLRAMPVPDLVLPGHPGSDPTPQRPRLSQARWLAMLDEGIRDLETLLARQKKDGVAFLDGRPKRLLPDLYYFGDYQGLATYGFFASSKLFVVDAPGGPGYAEFLKGQLKRLGLPAVDPTAVLLTSCNPKDTAGLRALVERTHCRVVCPPTGAEFIKGQCPDGVNILPADELPSQGWFPVTPLPLRGRGRSPMAYLLPWAGKTVLISGRIPILFDHDSTEALSSDLAPSRNDAVEYLLSINLLDGLTPEVWLPLVPSDEQNAFLYDSEWKYIIANNYRLGRSIMDRPR